VCEVIASVDQAADKASAQTREDMHRAYTHAAQLEWMFWDSAYRLGEWPV
jgi:thiaminase/transcriptional activator TenA